MAKRKPSTAMVPTGKKELRSQDVSLEASMQDGVPIPEEYSSMTDAYGLHVWVYAAAWAIASNYASLEYKAYRQGEDATWEEYDQHPWVKLLHKPNPYMSGYTLREFTSLGLELTGNSYWALEKLGGGEIKEIWPLPPGDVRAVSSKTRLIDHYLFSVNAKEVKYDYNEIVHFQYANPSSFIYGQGSLQAAKQSVLSDFYAQAWNKYFFQNSARPDAVFETDTILGDDVRKRVLAQWNSINRGVEKRGKSAVLEGGLKYKEVNRNPKDVDYIELRKQAREEILAAFGVPPIMCGVLENANYSNAKEQTSIFWKHTMMPKKRAIDQILTRRIQQLSFDPKTIFEADASNVEALRVDEFQRSQTCVNYYNIGVPPNQLIEAFDLPFEPFEGGETSKPSGSASGGAADQPSIPAGAGKALPPAKKTIESKDNTAIKDAEWKAFDLSISDREEDFRLSMRAFFRAQESRVLKDFDEHAGRLINHLVGKGTMGLELLTKAEKPTIDIDMIFNDAKEAARMRRTSDKYISGTYYDFAVTSGKRAKPNFNFNLQDPKSLFWIESKQVKLVKEVTAYTKQKLSKAIVDSVAEAVAEGFEASETIRQITARIEDTFKFAAEGRAERIARTEIISASNAGALEGLSQAGVEFKEWLSSRDSRVRDTHSAMDKEKPIPLAQDFVLPSGETLAFPGDPEGAPEEIINCRCTILSSRGPE